MHAPKIELRAHTYQYATEIKIQVIKLEDLWLARHAERRGGEARGTRGRKANGKRSFSLSPQSLSLFPHSPALSRLVTQVRRPSNGVSERR